MLNAIFTRARTQAGQKTQPRYVKCRLRRAERM